jgi:hypothetical protein
MMMASGRKRRLAPVEHVGIALFSVAYGLSGLFLGSRHDIYAICAVLWVGWVLAKGARPTIDRAAPALAVAFFLALLMVGYRSVLYLSNDKPDTPGWGEALTRDLEEDDVGIRYRITGVEFLVHAAAIETIDMTQKYDFAFNWLPVYTVHLIPRLWWERKPTLRLAQVPEEQLGPGITQADVRDTTGIRVAPGSATGIVAEMYMSFGLFSLPFFAWVGWCAKRLLFRAERLRTPVAMCAYVMVFSLGLNAFGQGFGSILVPLPYLMAPVFLYSLVDLNSHRRWARAQSGSPILWNLERRKARRER